MTNVSIIFTNKKISYSFSKNLSPINYLLVSICLCIGHDIKNLELTKDFKKIDICYEKDKIQIFCDCNFEVEKVFKKLIKNSFILRKTKFKHKIFF